MIRLTKEDLQAGVLPRFQIQNASGEVVHTLGLECVLKSYFWDQSCLHPNRNGKGFLRDYNAEKENGGG